MLVWVYTTEKKHVRPLWLIDLCHQTILDPDSPFNLSNMPTGLVLMSKRVTDSTTTPPEKKAKATSTLDWSVTAVKEEVVGKCRCDKPVRILVTNKGVSVACSKPFVRGEEASQCGFPLQITRFPKASDWYTWLQEDENRMLDHISIVRGSCRMHSPTNAHRKADQQQGR